MLGRALTLWRPFPFWHLGRWPVRAVERYQGPWNHTLANKVLVIGNKGDPVTPLASAKKLASLLGPKSAVLLQRDGYGVSLPIFTFRPFTLHCPYLETDVIIRFISAYIPCGGIHLHEQGHYELHGPWEVACAWHCLCD
jgi:hypothetical protein